MATWTGREGVYTPGQGFTGWDCSLTEYGCRVWYVNGVAIYYERLVTES